MTDLNAAGTAVCYADRAFEQLSQWPALEVCRTRGGTGLRVASSAVRVVTLSRPDGAEIRLTWPVIERLSDALTRSGWVWFEPGSDWLKVRLSCSSDLRLLGTLVSLAIRTHTT